MKTVFDFKGYRTQFPVGIKPQIMAVTLTHDDGTYGNYLILELDGIPYAAVPIVGKDGLEKLIRALQSINDNAFKESHGQETP